MTHTEHVASTGFPSFRLAKISPSRDWPFVEPGALCGHSERTVYLVRENPGRVLGINTVSTGDQADLHSGFFGHMMMREWTELVTSFGYEHRVPRLKLAAVLTEHVDDDVLAQLGRSMCSQGGFYEVSIQKVMVPR